MFGNEPDPNIFGFVSCRNHAVEVPIRILGKQIRDKALQKGVPDQQEQDRPESSQVVHDQQTNQVAYLASPPALRQQ